MITVAAGIVMLGILVFVHELGHFCVAKFCGVKVLKFSLGFGPKLVSRQWGETEYMICAIPLGGYVQMLGEGGGEQGGESISRPFSISPPVSDMSSKIPTLNAAASSVAIVFWKSMAPRFQPGGGPAAPWLTAQGNRFVSRSTDRG